MIFDFIDRHQNRIVHLSALFILLAGFGYSVYLGDSLRYPDAKKYYEIAVNLASGNGYSLNDSPTAFRTPGYPLLLAAFATFGAPIIFLRYLNFILLSISIYVIRSILSTVNAKIGAPLSVVLLVGYGVLFYTAGTLYAQTMFTLVLLLIIRLAIVPRFTYRHAVLLGILSTTFIMIHPSGVFIPPLIVLWLVFPKNWNMIGKGIVAFLVAVACLAPWTYRNYLIFDEFIPISSHGADTLYVGNNSNTDVANWYKWIEDEVYKKSCELSEKELRSHYLKEVVEFWTEHPVDAIKLYLEKVVYYFAYRNNLLVSNESSRLKDGVLFITYYPLLLCLILRLLIARKIPLSRVETLFAAIYIGSALFYAIFIPRIRFRLPFDVVLITHIGIMFSMLRERISLTARSRERLGGE